MSFSWISRNQIWNSGPDQFGACREKCRCRYAKLLIHSANLPPSSLHLWMNSKKTISCATFNPLLLLDPDSQPQLPIESQGVWGHQQLLLNLPQGLQLCTWGREVCSKRSVLGAAVGLSPSSDCSGLIQIHLLVWRKKYGSWEFFCFALFLFLFCFFFVFVFSVEVDVFHSLISLEKLNTLFFLLVVSLYA